jgi:uncharacterized DUF497 family protein
MAMSGRAATFGRLLGNDIMAGETIYDFEWDPAKALANVHKHGVSFDQAATVLLDPLALTVYDEGHSEDEERWFTLGIETTGKLLAVAHTYEITGPARVRVRVISARGATRREQRFYEDEPR